jgi:hypothetical protein
VPPGEQPQSRPHQRTDAAVERSDPERTDGLPAQGGDLGLGRRDRAVHGSGRLRGDVPRRREADPAPLPHDQRAAGLPFELLDLLAHRRAGDVECRRRGGDGAVVGHGREHAEAIPPEHPSKTTD